PTSRCCASRRCSTSTELPNVILSGPPRGQDPSPPPMRPATLDICRSMWVKATAGGAPMEQTTVERVELDDGTVLVCHHPREGIWCCCAENEDLAAQCCCAHDL